jgi:mRNA-degrading endonuclease RelE of RelBE toxin-antitoxin system
MEYRVTYLIDDEQTTVTVILVGSLPTRSRRR